MNALSLVSINATSAYEVRVAKNGDFVFQTEQGVIYGISFTEEFPIGGCFAYQFAITNLNQKHGSFDPRIQQIVLAIINEFFAKNQEVLLYLCDTSDKREEARNRLFLKWFREADQTNRFTIKTAQGIIENQGIYAAIIVENTNPHLNEIVEEFELTAQNFSK